MFLSSAKLYPPIGHYITKDDFDSVQGHSFLSKLFKKYRSPLFSFILVFEYPSLKKF